ncbi:hypothetical protein HHK36_013380 [Tetracentron sinense]|uniref:Conserved oligomeric Golgi complex subunit 1 n=1 Tax=Tetracentron sinense TaxID=13715 RepID=A0A835DJL6_TETSI|nr:hypothetical protein HHK36_013380 [Tetracentron sinense]
MRAPARSIGDPVGGYRDAESLFRSKPISEIRNVEAATKKEIEEKKEELRQLVGNRYRDLIDSADSIVLMKSSCESISANISTIDEGIRSLSSAAAAETPKLSPNPARVRAYGIASRVKYLVDTPENIWGCLDESMFLEASGKYLRAKEVHGLLVSSNADRDFLSNFPLLQHQWQIVESFKGQISQRGRERLTDLDLGIGAYADALAAVAVIDELDPKQVLRLFLDSRRSWICQKLATCGSLTYDSESVILVFCQVLRIIQVTLGQVGEMFLQVLNDMPLFYKIILGSPPGSQLFGGIPNPEEELRLWKLFREKLESVMVMLDREFISQNCSNWLRKCGEEIVSKVNGRYLIDVICSGGELASAERLIRETLDSREVLGGSLDWLRSVFGAEIELPWNRIRELVLENDDDLWDGIFEDVFVWRMKEIISSGFKDLSIVDVRESIRAIVADPGDHIDFLAYLNRNSKGGGVWFLEQNISKAGPGSGIKATADESDLLSCLNAYFGPEVSRIRDAVDNRCQSILEDLLCFLESPKAASRLKELAPYLQNKCYESMSTILRGLENELEHISGALDNRNKVGDSEPPAIIVERSLFIGRLLFAFQKHSSHIPLILGSPRLWVKDTMAAVFDKLPSLLRHSGVAIDSPMHDSPRRQILASSRRQTSLAATALYGVNDNTSPRLEELSRILRDLCIRAHSLWISWVSHELSVILSMDLKKDDALSATTSLRSHGWIGVETALKSVIPAGFRIGNQEEREGGKKKADRFQGGPEASMPQSGREVFRHTPLRWWDRALVCEFPQAIARGTTVEEFIHSLLPISERPTLIPYVGGKGIIVLNDLSSLRDLWSQAPWKLPGGGCIRFHRWRPDSNALPENFFRKDYWLGISGLPLHLWNTYIFRKIGEGCGSFLEIDEGTSSLTDLREARIRVKAGSRDSIPRRLNLSVQGVVLNLGVEVIEEEAVGNSGDRGSLRQEIANGTLAEEEADPDRVANSKGSLPRGWSMVPRRVREMVPRESGDEGRRETQEGRTQVVGVSDREETSSEVLPGSGHWRNELESGTEVCRAVGIGTHLEEEPQLGGPFKPGPIVAGIEARNNVGRTGLYSNETGEKPTSSAIYEA